MKDSKGKFRPQKKIICHLCNQPGHIKPNCPNLGNNSQHRSKANYVGKHKENDNVLLTTVFHTENIKSYASKVDHNDWVIDSGCTTHMSNQMVKNGKFEKKEVLVANNAKLTSNCVGDIELYIENSNKVTVKDVLYIPELATNLLSVNKITEKGKIVVFDKDSCRIYSENDCRIEGNSDISAVNDGGVYKLNLIEPTELNGQIDNSSAALTVATKGTWHRRLAI